MTQNENIYEMIGGQKTIAQLVNVFYDRVKQDPDLAPIFPENLTETKQKQTLFLTQFFGGPQLYSDQYGHPMLRARHMPFPVTPTRARAWLNCMSGAMDEIGLAGVVRQYMFERLTFTAQHMVNTPDDSPIADKPNKD
jgi:hemoglobin